MHVCKAQNKICVEDITIIHSPYMTYLRPWCERLAARHFISPQREAEVIYCLGEGYGFILLSLAPI